MTEAEPDAQEGNAQETEQPSIFDRRWVPLTSRERRPVTSRPNSIPDGFREENDQEFAQRLIRQARDTAGR